MGGPKNPAGPFPGRRRRIISAELDSGLPSHSVAAHASYDAAFESVFAEGAAAVHHSPHKRALVLRLDGARTHDRHRRSGGEFAARVSQFTANYVYTSTPKTPTLKPEACLRILMYPRVKMPSELDG